MFLVGVLKFKISEESSITKSFYQITGLLSRIYTLLKKSNICEKGGTHLRIYVWLLLMNLKNNYLLKKLLK